MRAVTIIGPSQSGKSTLAAALAGLEGSRARPMHFMGDVQARSFDFMGEPWTVFDVPGGVENAAQIGPVLAASDAAVLCVPADTGAAVLSAPCLRLLENSGVPTFLFINRMDMTSERVADIVASLQTYCAHGIVLRQVPMRTDGEITGAIDLISERAWEYNDGQRSSLVELPGDMRNREQEARSDLLESLADFDDALLEQIIEDQAPLTDDVYDVVTRTLQHHDLVPALLGSAVHGNGILRLMKSLRHEVPEVDALRHRLGLGSDVLAAGAVADSVAHLGKTVLIRALADGIAPGATLGGAAISGLNDMSGKGAVPHLSAGEFGIAIKSDHLDPGVFFNAAGSVAMPDWAQPHPPALRRLVRPVHERDESKLSGALARLEEIDPGLSVSQDAVTGLREIGVQGPQHLRRVVDKLADGFGIEVEASAVPTALRETIRRGMTQHFRHRKQSGGAGQFADIVIDIAPLPAGAGFRFDDTVKGGAVPRNYIPAVEHGAREAIAEGPEGHPVVDIAVTLKDGKAHSVDSSDFAFRTAGKNGVRAALAELGTIVLQPIMNVQIHVPSVFAGDLVQLVSGLKGQVVKFEAHPTAAGWDVFSAQLPMAAQEDLARALSSATRGTAWFSCELNHYEELRAAAVARN
ncbi:MAG: elongation factor G [Marinibacterium sp.]